MTTAWTTRSVRGTLLGVSDDGRHLVDRTTGSPWFYLADTAWTLFKRLSPGDVEHYLSTRAAQGFSAIQAYVLRGLDVTNLDGHRPLVDRDPTRLDEGFFGNVDRIVDRANELGLVMALVATMGEHVRHRATSERFRNDEQIFDVDNAFAYGRILGERYADHAVIWYLGGDRSPIPADVAVWDAMGRGLKTGSAGRHLVSYHSSGGYSSSESFHDADWLDFDTIQSIHRSADPNYVLIRRDRALSPAKPTLDMEARYEGHPDLNEVRYGDPADVLAAAPRIDGHQVREAAYWAVLAGAAGHGYGHNSVWQMADPARPGDEADYSFPVLPASVGWRQALESEGATSMGHLRRLLERHAWQLLEPDLAMVADGQGLGEAHIQGARAADGSFALAYLPFGHQLSAALQRLRGPLVEASWFDPRTGASDTIGTYRADGAQAFQPPTTGPTDDWVLELRSA